MKTLAEIAIEAKLASEKVLERAAELADKRKVPLVEALLEETEIDEVALVGALRKHLRVKLADPGKITVETEALRTLSQEVCRRQRVMPLAVVYENGERCLHLAMADPTDALALTEVEERTGLTVVPELMTFSAIAEMVEAEYKNIVTEVIKRDRRLFGGGVVGAMQTPGGDPQGTVPYHKISDEAELSVRFEALLRLLIENKIISEDEFEEEVRELLKGGG